MKSLKAHRAEVARLNSASEQRYDPLIIFLVKFDLWSSKYSVKIFLFQVLKPGFALNIYIIDKLKLIKFFLKYDEISKENLFKNLLISFQIPFNFFGFLIE